MNFERKAGKKQFLTVLSETQEQKLEKIRSSSFQVGVHFVPGNSQPDTFIHSLCAIED